MLDYNGNTYIRPYAGYSQPIKNEQNSKLQQSTTSISSNLSDSCRSVSKYSFKTGQLKNVYTFKQKTQNYPILLNRNSQCQPYRHQPDQQINPLIQRNQQKNIYLTKNQSEKSFLNRSQSCNSSLKRYKPIPDPPIKSYLQYESPQKNFYQHNSLRDQRKMQLYKGNETLKKSVSQKRFVYERKFSQLNIKVNFLKNQFTRQQNKMQKITAVIKQYFG